MILFAWLLAVPGVVDRVEGAFAVVEWDGRMTQDVPLAALPSGITEGDALIACPSLRSGLALPPEVLPGILPGRTSDSPVRWTIHERRTCHSSPSRP